MQELPGIRLRFSNPLRREEDRPGFTKGNQGPCYRPWLPLGIHSRARALAGFAERGPEQGWLVSLSSGRAQGRGERGWAARALSRGTGLGQEATGGEQASVPWLHLPLLGECEKCRFHDAWDVGLQTVSNSNWFPWLAVEAAF